jgi:signal peptidase II
MKKREWLIVFLPLILTWLADRFTKEWAMTITGTHNFGPVTFLLHHNPGAMLGLFADLPPVLRVVSLSTGGAFMVCTYAIIQYLLPIKSITLRAGLSILLGGILGNVADRIFYGHIIDFIVLGNENIFSPAFNVADALQWVGHGLIVWAVVREGELLWPEHNARRLYWINTHFQLKYCLFLFGVGLGLGLISLVFSYTYLRVTMLELVGNNPALLDKFLYPFAITFSLITIGFCFALFMLGKIISHKIAGPVYAFEKFINESIAGTNRPFKLRTKDEFKHLEALAIKIQDHLIKHNALPSKHNADELPAEIVEMEGAEAVANLEDELKKRA